MDKDTVILVAEDDKGHAGLIIKNLRRAGIENEIIHFLDGEAVLDFLFQRGTGHLRRDDKKYILILDIRMPKIDGIEVLLEVKDEAMLKNMPVIMLTTTDNPETVRFCYEAGSCKYIVKPVDYDKFVRMTEELSSFIKTVEVP
ncbi:MAG: response regulator [Nitrospirae bacterium]|nr:response regulator [Nitrospirota bacterium]